MNTQKNKHTNLDEEIEHYGWDFSWDTLIFIVPSIIFLIVLLNII